MKANKLTKETILNAEKSRNFPAFTFGDTIQVAQIVKEGSKERIQMFMGDVICIKNNGISSTFTVRRIGANNTGVEKIFPYHSPMIDSIKLIKQGIVRRAKLYYLRDRVGRSARIKEKITTKTKKQKSVKNKKGAATEAAPTSVDK